MKNIGLGKFDVLRILRRNLTYRMDDPVINSIAKALGEIIEENNQKLAEDLKNDSKR